MGVCVNADITKEKEQVGLSSDIRPDLNLGNAEYRKDRFGFSILSEFIVLFLQSTTYGKNFKDSKKTHVYLKAYQSLKRPCIWNCNEHQLLYALVHNTFEMSSTRLAKYVDLDISFGTFIRDRERFDIVTQEK